MGINKSDEDGDWFTEIIAVFYRIMLFLSPMLLFGVVGVALIITNEDSWIEYAGYASIGVGFLLGIILAMYVRRKHGLIEFDSSLSSSKDIDEWLKKEREKIKNKIIYI